MMQEIMFSAVMDSIAALKTASKGLPNTLLRDLNAIHANTTFADLPPELQAAITASVRAAFSRLLKEGYSISSGQAGGLPARGSTGPRDAAGRPPFQGRPPMKRDGDDNRRPPRGDGRPNRKPRPS
nr:hypothetical protein [Sphingomonas formosensis]